MFNTNAPLLGLCRLDRATSNPSTDEGKTAEVQRVTATLKPHGYPARFIDSCKSRKPRERLGDPAVTRNLVVLSYAKGASEKFVLVIARALVVEWLERPI